jgi:hypothetical protein
VFQEDHLNTKNTLKNAGDMVYKFSWARDPGVYGFFNMKEQQSPDCSLLCENGPFYWDF